jgi:carboxyl-terminal processing protease
MSVIKRSFVLVFLVVTLFISFGLGFWTGKESKICKICPPEDIDFSLFWQAYNTLQEKFARPEKIDIEKIIYGAISGMVETLEDPYTVFFNPQETEEFEKQLSGIYEGVGMEIGIKNEQLTVIAPLEGTPAQKAGLRPGDKIFKVDNIDTVDISIDEAVKLIRGPKGTEVTLTIFREGWEKAKEIKIRRATIKIPSLKWELMDENIAYIHIYQFHQPLISDFRKAAIEILASPSQKIILDLRNNPGGYLDVAQDIAEWFLEKDDIIVIEDYGARNEENIYRAERDGEFFQYPIVILINQGSASGSEILAAALRDNRNIKIIGETSFGKGSIQESVKLRGGSSLKITIAKWLTSEGKSISEIGITPDIKIEITEEDYARERDPQLEKAIEIIKEMR